MTKNNGTKIYLKIGLPSTVISEMVRFLKASCCDSTLIPTSHTEMIKTQALHYFWVPDPIIATQCKLTWSDYVYS